MAFWRGESASLDKFIFKLFLLQQKLMWLGKPKDSWTIKQKNKANS